MLSISVFAFNSLDTKLSFSKGGAQYEPDYIDPSLCTHLIYSTARIDDTFVMIVGDEKIDIENSGYEKMVALKKENPKLKVMISLGDGDTNEKYINLHSDPKKIKRFVESAVNFLERYGFDGIHLDFLTLYSADHQGDVPALLRALNDAFESKKYLISATVFNGHGLELSYGKQNLLCF